MARRPGEPQNPTVHDHFGRFASLASAWLGSTWAFLFAGLVIAAWGATGPIFHFSDRWTQVASTATALMTFLMVFLIQNTQNRDGAALQAKLDELIRVTEAARNAYVGIEKMPEKKLEELRENCEAEIETSSR